MNSWATSTTMRDAVNGVSHNENGDQFPALAGQQQQAAAQAVPVQPSPSTHILPPGLASTSRASTPLATNNGINAANAVLGITPSTAENNENVVDEDQIPDIEKFGLNGLLSTIKMEYPDQVKFTMGTDVNMLGLDFLEKGKLSVNFETPWPEIIRSEVEPDSKTQAKVFESVEPQNLTEDKLASLTDETLFFIFYTRPNHYLQEWASKQLNSRNWRFHKDLQLWLTKDSQVEPVQQNNQSERGIYIFFDPSSWEKVKKEFVLQYASLHQAI